MEKESGGSLQVAGRRRANSLATGSGGQANFAESRPGTLCTLSHGGVSCITASGHARVANQDPSNQSIVLVNGLCIAPDLQRVE